jgi:hypothetical protein
MSDEIGPAEGWRSGIWPRPKPKPTPAPEPGPAPAPAPDGGDGKAPAAIARAWWILRNTDLRSLRAVFTFVPLTVFFAVSGLVVWTLLTLRALIWLVKAIVN